ncbi:MAG: MFS transporter [Planctomycetes bacterium]|nr:MFS transporter [Planctomycetota bacterium]
MGESTPNGANGASSDAAKEPAHKRAFTRAYWMCNSIEMFERLAYFGIRAVVPIYIMQATEPGGLHLTAVHKGWIYGWWAFFQSILPMVTGGFADRYGYKRILVGAISANVIGYVMMAYMQSYYGFFAGILVLATGTAFFKPALQGTIAQNLTRETSSLGWGIFYWVVNVGAVMAPILATLILGRPHSAEGWRNLFLASAVFTSVNFLLLLTFKDVPSGADKSERFIKVFGRTIENVWPYWFVGGTFDRARGVVGGLLFGAGFIVLSFKPFAWGASVQSVLGWVAMAVGGFVLTWLRGGRFVWQLRLPAFLLIMSCFWMMMYQLWDLHPNFIEDWVDSSMIAAHVPFDVWKDYGDRGLIRVPQQILLNLNAFLIILLVVPISWLVRKMRALSSMLIGMMVATGGIVIAGLTGNGWTLLLGVAFFSLGEMLTGPKKNEYLGRIAPRGKKGLYLGYVNIPIGLGVGIGSIVAGHVYGAYGEKASLALKHFGANTELLARAVQGADWSDSLELIPELLGIDRNAALDLAAEELGQARDAAAATLRSSFRYDRGQITNLGLTYLALDPEFSKKATTGLASALAKRDDDPASQIEERLELGRKLSEGEVTIDQIGVARFVDLLPKVMGTKRVEVLEVLRDRINRGLSADKAKENTDIVDMLWDRFGNDRETLNNLALEYLAQGTNRMRRVVETMTFDDPVTQIEKRVGIGRTKSFAALSAAMGADDEAVERELAGLGGRIEHAEDRAYVYLAQQKHHRFRAVGRRDWKKDVALLEEMIESDPEAKAAIPVDSDGKTMTYAVLAGKQGVVQKVLDAKDWRAAPEHAGRVLGLNPWEATALVSAELNRSPIVATKMLWDTYNPQYHVWLPFAAVGVFATIALAIFGQMAKRWDDMNA